MTELSHSQGHILAQLQARAEINELQADYWWLLDSKQFDRMVERVFTPDLHFYQAIGSEEPSLAATSAQQWADTVSGALSGAVTVHQGHQSKLVFHDDASATGRFVLNDHILHASQGWAMRGLGYYVNDYRRTDAGWRISVMRLGYIAVERGAAPNFDKGDFWYPEGEL